MPQVVFQTGPLGSNYSVYYVGPLRNFGISKISGDFPAASYRITDARVSVSLVTEPYSNRTYRILANNGATYISDEFVSYINESQHEKTFVLYPGFDYANITSIGWLGTATGGSSTSLSLRSGAYITLTITWEYSYTACQVPATVSLSGSLAEIDGNVFASWSDAAPGTDNPITGYELSARESGDGGSTWGAYFVVKTVSTAATSGSTSLPPSGTRGNILDYRIRTLGAAGETYYSGYQTIGQVRRNGIPAAPTAFSASPALRETDTVNLAWSGHGDADSNYDHQEIEYATKPLGGSYGSYAALKTAIGSGATTVPSLADGTRITYRTRSVDTFGIASDWVYSNEVVQNSAPYAPSNLRFTIGNGGYFYASMTCQWNNNGDADANFSGFYIRLARFNHDPAYGAVGWGWLDTDWVWIGNVTSLSITRAQLMAKGAKAGDAIAFGVVGQDAMGAQNWDAAGMASSGWIYLAADPSAPSIFSASPEIQETGVTLAWSGASGNGIAITGYDVEYKVAVSEAGTNGPDGYAPTGYSPISYPATSGSLLDPAAIDRGYYVRWRIKTRNAENGVSAWKYSNAVRKNSAPIAPVILFPGAGKTIYNNQPYVGLTISAEPDGQTQTLYYSIDGGAAQSGGTVTAGTKKLRMLTLAAGARTLRFWTQDSLGVASGQAAVTVTVAANIYERTIANHTKIWDQANGIKHAPEIMQMLGRVNQIRAYYGLAAISLPYGGTTGEDTIRHFHTWLANMQAIYNGLAATCAVSGATLAALNTGGQKRPAPGVINQIRTAIGNL